MQFRPTGMMVPRTLALISGLLLAAAMLPGGIGGAPARAQATITLQNPLDLDGAIASLDGQGGTILLPGGDYPGLYLQRGGREDSPLVLRSADPAKPARFARMELKKVRHAVLEDVVLDYRFSAGDPIHTQPFAVLESQDITLRGVLIDGDDAGPGAEPQDVGYGYGVGLNIRFSARILIENSEIRGFHRGIGVGQSADFTLRGSEIHDLRSDGLNFAEVEGVLVENNYIHDFTRPTKTTDHADMIQFWTVGTKKPSRDVVIRYNVLNSGRGLYTQSIFMRNELVDQGKAGKELFYRNISIVENVIINAHLHGITLGETIGLEIANNTLIQNDASIQKGDAPRDSEVWTPRITVSGRSQDVRITRNVVATVSGPEGQPDWVVEDNFRIQNRGRAEGGFYTTVFVNPLKGDPRDLRSFAYLPGGPLDGAGIGASRLAAK